MTDVTDDDAPMLPSQPVWTTGALVVRMEMVLEQVEGLRGQVGTLTKVIGESDRRRSMSLPGPGSLPAVGAPRPSLAVQAAKGTTHVGKVLMIATGVLSVAGQVIAIWRPEYGGPIIDALRLLASLGG